ncbi:YggT family protein [Streptococcus oricebi]|uniref:YggT family protein n=1 Tax=Streptococcus oricebi TaxID=1547447 RepID=A0ABS5B221_9STRE|nr:YggT family protein [Streptococcus oricebi]MBP2622716.1 hypothetical protein [Streptococcus oricebi]
MFFIIQLCYNLLRLYSLLFLVYALLSWFPGAYQTGFGRFVSSLTEPVLRPFRRLNLQFGGLDFTVLAVMFFLNILGEFLIRLLYLFLF